MERPSFSPTTTGRRVVRVLRPLTPAVFFSCISDSVRGGRLELTLVGDLVIRGVEKSDEGRYVCRAENVVGFRESRMAQLTVHGSVSFAISRRPRSSKNFHIFFWSSVRNKITKEKDPMIIFKGTSQDSEFGLTGAQWAMVITSLQTSTYGSFICLSCTSCMRLFSPYDLPSGTSTTSCRFIGYIVFPHLFEAPLKKMRRAFACIVFKFLRFTRMRNK